MMQEEQPLKMVEDERPDPATQVFPPNFHVLGSAPARLAEPVSPERDSIEPKAEDLQWVGVNGRCNKVADTCYSFWVGGSLGVSQFRSDSDSFNLICSANNI